MENKRAQILLSWNKIPVPMGLTFQRGKTGNKHISKIYLCQVAVSAREKKEGRLDRLGGDGLVRTSLW